MNNKDEVLEYLIAQLRQRVNSNQCGDLMQEVQSLKNRLRDVSVLVAELQETIKLMNEDFDRVTNHGGPLPKGKSYVVGEHGPEQSGCRKEDVQECDHNWIIAPGLFIAEGHKDNVPGSRFCCECGAREWDDDGHKPKADTQKCKHEWEYYYPNGEEHRRCAKCGVISE
ncbi:putative tolA-binding protein [Salmonella phage 5sent1]|uniref:Putative tolA-binding protein n=1 Tax=Salmonella phage 5sent1 TaxID=2762669 RepID=A0A7G8ANT3_9CAUD|nr:putative tolA-binding protein [Salmonella phage 5sent1]QNI21785.1 putative tolA-binding protein [Salmonella phage 5sent1]